jgi:hypothetical protein
MVPVCPPSTSAGLLTAILPALVRSVALHVVVMDKALVDGKDLLPGAPQVESAANST